MPRAYNNRNTPIDYINRDIVSIKNEVQTLSKLLRDGNGQPSIMQQVATLNNGLIHLEGIIKKDIYELRENITHCSHATLQKDKISWQFKSAVLVAVISSITSIIIQLLN
jgi:hypothetical protein